MVDNVSYPEGAVIRRYEDIVAIDIVHSMMSVYDRSASSRPCERRSSVNEVKVYLNVDILHEIEMLAVSPTDVTGCGPGARIQHDISDVEDTEVRRIVPDTKLLQPTAWMEAPEVPTGAIKMAAQGRKAQDGDSEC
jgi:hypothetical protein